MTTRFKRLMLVLGTTILIMQAVFMPVVMVYAETTIDTEEQELMALPPMKNYLGEEQISDPRFFFTRSRMQGTAKEPLQVTFFSDQEVSEARVFLPEEATLIKEQLLEGTSVLQGEHTREWIVRSEHKQNTFDLPLIFGTSGNYVVSIGEAKVSIEIESTETVSSDEPRETNLNQKELNTFKENIEDVTDNDREVSYSSNEMGVAEVTNWIEFGQALGTPSITTIEIIEDFEVPNNSNVPGFITGVGSNPSGSAQFAYLTPANSSRRLVVNGNGHHIDFGSVSLVPRSVTHNEQSPWDITFNDAIIYSGNWWGVWSVQQGLTLAQQQNSKIAVKDVSFVGNQMLAPYYTPVDLYGKIDNHVVTSYNSPFRTNFAVNTPNSINIESRSLTIKEDAVVNFSTLNSGNIVIGVGGVSGSLTLEKNATLNIESNGTVASANVNAKIGSSIDISNGNLILNEGSTINIDTSRSYAAISLRSSNSSLEIIDGAKLNINSNNYAYTINGVNRNLVSMSSGSSIIVGSDGELKVNAERQGNASANIFHVSGASNFTILKDGLLDIQSDSTSISQSLLSFASANSTFRFSDAKRVNLERTGTIAGVSTTNGLINITGSTGLLDIDVQSVKQWSRGSFESTPDHSWTPVFNLNLRYTGVVPRIDTVSSISQETMDSFNQHFTTQNIQRILFEKIPDVGVTINPLTEDPNEVNSYTITGKANPNSVVRFSGDAAIPAGTITSPNISENEKYHTMADGNGDYRYELPEGRRFTAGKTVNAYAFLNGKNNTASTVVEEKIVVSPVDPLDPETEVEPENKPEIPEDQGKLSIDFISSFDFGSQSISVHDQTYYAQPQRLLNEDGTANENEERPNYVQISDRRSEDERNGWELAVTQKEQFKSEEKQILDGASLRLLNQQVITAQGGTSPVLQSFNELVPGNRRTLLKAQVSEGTGTWVYRFGNRETAGESVALDVPSGATPEAATYSTTLIWELSTVPENY